MASDIKVSGKNRDHLISAQGLCPGLLLPDSLTEGQRLLMSGEEANVSCIPRPDIARGQKP